MLSNFFSCQAITSQQGGSKLTPRWYEKVKGEKGFLYHNDGKKRGEEQLHKIVERIKEGAEEKDTIKKDEVQSLRSCFGSKGKGADASEERKCNEVFIGWFRQGNSIKVGESEDNECLREIRNDRSKVCGIAFVLESSNLKGVARSLGLKDNSISWCKDESEGLKNYQNKRCAYINETRDWFINRWMSSGKKISLIRI